MLNIIILRLTELMLALVPFHALGSTILKYGLGLSKYKYLNFLISAWKEILIIFIGFLITIQLKNFKKYNSVILTIIAYTLLGLTSYLWAKPEYGLSQFILGFRYDFLFLFAFMIFSISQFSKKRIENVIKISLYSASIVIILGLLIYFIGAEHLTSIGFRNEWSTWYPNQALAYCQKLENSSFCRLSSSFGGPNTYGTYLIVMLPLLFWKVSQNKSKLWMLITTLGIISLFLTASRSAFISFIIEISVFLFLFFYTHNKINFNLKKIAIALILTFTIIISLISLNIDSLKKNIIRPGSTSKHIEGLIEAVSMIKNHPFGIGLGMAGPSSYKFSKTVDDAIIPENWYLQIGIENGLIAIVLFISILYQIIRMNLKNYFKEKKFDESTVLTISLIGVSFCGLMVHSFEDASTVFTLFTLLGITYKNSSTV